MSEPAIPSRIEVLREEVAELRARLAEVEAERDDLDDQVKALGEACLGHIDRARWATEAARRYEARLAKVEALCDRAEREEFYLLHAADIRAAARGQREPS